MRADGGRGLPPANNAGEVAKWPCKALSISNIAFAESVGLVEVLSRMLLAGETLNRGVTVGEVATLLLKALSIVSATRTPILGLVAALACTADAGTTDDRAASDGDVATC